ncbi:MAG: ammonium transporter [Nitrososphaerota archaeon]|jgi:Amt family ammonium transporter|nr:ammonium transporter [Nitrososphaerota archaeon]MDG7041301.1 ammonium transporter [Nitrososphaerota archaeon]MDG7042477.1 ammonium transporter [Nitrososphaerota archaeon]MDG7046673.1 ammonium transporter [Nitrososphaerota archaeon]
MTIAVGFLEVGELGEQLSRSLLKTTIMMGTAIFVMAVIGFNTAFAPTIDGIIGNPFYYSGAVLGLFSNPQSFINGVWWSMTSQYFGTGLTTSTYFLFETAFASVTLALVGVVALRKMKLSAFFVFSIIYFIIIWNLPAAWIWNPTGWLYLMGMRDFAGGLVVHGAAGAAGVAILYKIWREERKAGLKESPQQPIRLNEGWLTLSILFLFMGWFGFNPGSVLAFNGEALVVVVTTFLAAGTAMISLMGFKYLLDRKNPGLLYSVNGILMGLIVITPLAGFVSPASALALGFLGGPLFLAGEKWFARYKWMSDPVGLLPGHTLGGIFGVVMIAFFTQHTFAVASGNAILPNGLLFGGGLSALHQLGIEIFGIVVVVVAVFLISYAVLTAIGASMHGITTKYKNSS